MKRTTCAVLVFMLCLALCPASVAASTEAYHFTERIVYGGTAVDCGEFIYFANPDDGMNLYRRTAGRDDSELIYANPVGYLNLLGERLYFISENRIVSTSLSGKDEKILYSSQSNIIDLYAAPDCLYFLENRTVKKYEDGTAKTLFSDEELCAFLPLSKTEFKCYKANPDYIEIDQSDDEIYEESAEKYLTYIYNTELKSKKRVAEAFGAASGYAGPYVNVGSVTLPLKEYMPGSFFSKNGRACACHHNPDIDCIASINGCNCMRYWPTGLASTCEIDLLGAQCFAFARFVFYRCFGFIDHPYYSADKYYSAGSLPSGSVTANTVKELFMKTKTGAHVRLSRGHSVSVFTMDEQTITVYHGNAGGDGVASQACVVSTKRYTWADFAAYAAAGISYANMPYDYPGTTNAQKKSEGYYKLNSNMNVRAGTGTSYKIIGQLNNGSFVKILQVSNGWGRIEHNESTNRWISLDYADFASLPAIRPKEDAGVVVDDTAGYLLGIHEKTDVQAFRNAFWNNNLSISDRFGNTLSDTGYIGTGCVVNMIVNETVTDSKKVLVKGDANGNGIVDVGDYLMLKRIALGNYQPESIYLLAADISGDSQIDSLDCFLMKKYLVGTSDNILSEMQE